MRVYSGYKILVGGRIAVQWLQGIVNGMGQVSAGLLLYRRSGTHIEVLLVHPGGPFWARKDLGAWSIPKGEFDPSEHPLEAAKREFAEETGTAIEGRFLPLAPVRQAGGKTVHAWAVEGRFDPGTLRSNTFSLEWPRGSGQMRQFPEVDHAAWFPLEEARKKILEAQAPLLDQLETHLRGGTP